MSRQSLLWVAGAVLAFPMLSGAWPRSEPPPAPTNSPATGLWHVEFANGVKETCEIRTNGAVSVEEPSRSSLGKAAPAGNAVLVIYEDDRIERWNQIGSRYVVEHWFPASQWPAGVPVLGIADRVE